MKVVNELKNKDMYRWVAEIKKIANEAVALAKEENKRYGIPEHFFKNGKMYYILENGEITTEKPEILK